MNSSYGSDGMNTEKYTEIKVMDQKEALKAHLSNTFMDEQQLSPDSYAVQLKPETCTSFDMDKVHYLEGDTDSAYWAVSGLADAGYLQQFNHVIKDKQFYEDNAKYYFPTIKNNLLDEKKVLGHGRQPTINSHILRVFLQLGRQQLCKQMHVFYVTATVGALPEPAVKPL
ncbi:MAG: hypothetical protein EZS28_004457 [Streblomastix strix]|uniref:Uncharacterized protein n=1 Tax=Streblomastix strix TaxID=222440 RepID=A0A5J4WYU6_9EUKA|nr:MAG: hypothetical protein EZS28_004457 [Streblomastix strix]